MNLDLEKNKGSTPGKEGKLPLSSNVILTSSLCLIVFAFTIGFIFYFIFITMESSMVFTSGIQFCRWIEHFFQKKLTLPSEMHYYGLGVLLSGNILTIASSMFALGLVLSWIRIDARKEKTLDNDGENETSQIIEDIKKPSFAPQTERKQAVRFGIQV